MSIRRALILSVSGRYVAVAIQLVGSLVVARLLSPTDFGLFAIAGSVVAVSSSLREFGITNYLIQLPTLDRVSLGRAVAFTMSVSLACGLPLFLFRDGIAGFFGDPRIAMLIAILSLSFLLVPLSIGTAARLHRDLRQGMIQLIGIIGTIVATAVTIVMAIHDYGPVALAVGQIVQLTVMVISFAVIEPVTLLCMPVFTGLGPMFRFGSFSALAGVVNQVGNYGTSLILGRMLGPAAVGFFERGNGLVQTVYNDLLGGVAQIVLVGMAKARGDARLLAQLLLTSLANLTAALWPMLALLAVLAEPVIVVLFGAQWTPAVPVLQVLCASSLLATAHALYGRMLLVMTRPDRIFYVEASGQMVRLLVVFALAGFGLTAAAFGAVVASFCMLVLYVISVRRYVRLARRDILRVYLVSLAITAATGAPPALLVLFNPFELPPFLLLAIGGSLGCACWVAALFAAGHSMAAEVTNIWRKMIAIGQKG